MLALKNNVNFQQNFVATLSLKSETLESSKASQHTAEVGVLNQIKTKDSFCHSKKIQETIN